MRAVILHPYDPGARYASGIRTAIDGFIRAAPADLRIDVVGCAAPPNGAGIGRWTEVDVGERTVRFLPILAGHPAGRPTIPLSLRYAAALLRSRKHLDLSDAVLMFHRLETAWPLTALPNPKLMFLHYSVPDQVLRTATPDRWRHIPGLYFWLERRILPRIDRVYCPRMDAVNWWQDQYPERADRIRFLPSFVNDAIFHVENEADRRELRTRYGAAAGAPPDAKLGIFVGRFDHQKDPLLLLRAWRELRRRTENAHLILIGEGPLERPMREFARAKQMSEHIHFTGPLPHTEIAHWLNAADVMVMSSLTEGMSMSMMEALRCGLPVVAPNLGESARLVSGPEAGRLIDARTPENIARAVHEVLEQQRSREACADCVKEYRPEKVLEPVFHWILDAGSRLTA